MNERTRTQGSAPVFVSALVRAFQRPIAWTFGLFALSGMAVVASLPVYRWFADTVDNAYEPNELLHHLDVNFRTDHAEGLAQLFRTVGTSADWMMAVVVLIGVFSAGGWLRTLVDPGTYAARRLFYAGGARYFWRFLRFAVVVIVLLGLFGTLLYHADSQSWQNRVLAGWPEGKSERALSERSVVYVQWARDGLFALLTFGVLAWACLVRTRIVLQNRRSVVLAALQTSWLVLRHPLVTLRPLVILTVIEGLLLLGAGGVGRLVQGGLADDGGVWRVILLFAIGGITISISEIVQGARYAASVDVSRSFVRPIAIDPWRDRVGGPGGPQYPVGPDDDYTIAV
ncbi:hypothetical protein Pla163_36050 [Planctomycetes bacterium Pla163]|uniref:Uncharacterized protein n=1 Tax=Rohdeia mirabilis TaxID=2528008 RepID=A0A518D4R7_9BACT|nr:hypothetical protein Pla163_36050 [Planctomycetes bacterium Pla163]